MYRQFQNYHVLTLRYLGSIVIKKLPFKINSTQGMFSINLHRVTQSGVDYVHFQYKVGLDRVATSEGVTKG